MAAGATISRVASVRVCRDCMGSHTIVGMSSSHRDRYIEPAVGADSVEAVDAAVEMLGVARGFGGDVDATVRLHLLVSLAREVEQRLAGSVAAAREQGCSWAAIGDLVGVTRASAWQRFGP